MRNQKSNKRHAAALKAWQTRRADYLMKALFFRGYEADKFDIHKFFGQLMPMKKMILHHKENTLQAENGMAYSNWIRMVFLWPYYHAKSRIFKNGLYNQKYHGIIKALDQLSLTWRRP